MEKIKRRLNWLDTSISKEIGLDIAFPDRKNSKTESLKAEILNLERHLDLLERGLEDQTYEEYKQEYMSQEPSEPADKSKDDEIAELEAKLAALRG